MYRAAHQHALRIYGPEADGAVAVTQADAVGVDPCEASGLDHVFVGEAQSSDRVQDPF